MDTLCIPRSFPWHPMKLFHLYSQMKSSEPLGELPLGTERFMPHTLLAKLKYKHAISPFPKTHGYARLCSASFLCTSVRLQGQADHETAYWFSKKRDM